MAVPWIERVEPIPHLLITVSRNRLCLCWVLLFFFIVSMPGCAVTSTGEQRGAHHPKLAVLRKVQVQVSGSEKMYLSMHGERGGEAGTLVGGISTLAGGIVGANIIAAAVESGIRMGIDQDIADAMTPGTKEGPSVPQWLEQSLIEDLSLSKHFDAVTSTRDSVNASDTQARILVSLIHWGLYPPVRNVGNGPDGHLQVGIEAIVKIVDVVSGDILWTSKELYLHGKDHALAEYQSKPDLLKQEVDDAVVAVSHRLSNAIRGACR